MSGTPAPDAGHARRHEAVITAELEGMRLDQALSVLFTDYSRTMIKRWIERGEVTVDTRPCRPRDPVHAGDRITLTAHLAASAELTPQSVAFEVVHEDADCLVVAKPVGCVVHPGAGNPDTTLANGLLARYPELAALPRAGLIHRLDKDTSGLLMVGRTSAAFRHLTEALARREVRRVYDALVNGVMVAGGTVDAPIGRDPQHRTRMRVARDGRPAVTHYRVRTRFRAHTAVEVHLETGRTHQIRVHLAHVGFPLVGDTRYGGRLRLPPDPAPELETHLRAFHHQALHARTLAFPHPRTGDVLEFSIPPPADFAALEAALAADVDAHGV